MNGSNNRDMNRLVAETIEGERREFEAGRKWPEKLTAPPPPDASRLEAALIDEAYHLEHAGDGRILKRLFCGIYLCAYQPGDTKNDQYKRLYRYMGSHWERDPHRWQDEFMLALGEAYNGRARDFLAEWNKTRDKLADLQSSKKIISAHIKEITTEAKAKKAAPEGLAEAEGRLKEIEEQLSVLVSSRSAVEKTAKAFEARAKRCLAIPRMLHAANAAFSGADGLLLPRGAEWNNHPTWLPCANGTINLEDGRLMESSPDHYFNMAVEWEYRGLDEPCPEWMEMVAKIFGRDEEMINYMEHIIGSAVTGVALKNLIIAMGPMANNGKSLFFGTISRCLGSFVREIAVDLLLKQNNKSSNAAHPEILRLRGARLAVAQESDSSDVLDTGQVKLLTSGGDAREARTLYGEEYQRLEQTHTLLVHTNKPPRLSEGDRGLANRLVIIPFNTQFVSPDQPEDPGNHIYHAVDRYELERTFTLEMSGILAWLVRCAMKFLANGRRLPPPPPMVATESSDYMTDNDIIKQFKDSMCLDTPDANAKIGAREFYRSFRKFCEDVKDMTSKEIISSTRFGREAKSHFRSSHVNGRVYYFDVTLRFQPIEDD